MSDNFKRDENGYIQMDFRKLIDWDGPSGCIVSNRISKDGWKVGYMYRDEPSKNNRDSGWTFTAGDEEDDYINNPVNLRVSDLNTVCNYDPDIIPYLTAPVGSEFIRKGEHTFERCDALSETPAETREQEPSGDQEPPKEPIYEQESYYDFLANDENELMVTIKARVEEPEEPKLIYAGGEHALLDRSRDRKVILDFIHPGIREILDGTEKLLVMELKNGDVARGYEVSVEHVDELPIPDDKLPI